MTAAAVVFAVLVLAFAAAARGLGRVYVTAPIAFVIAGAVISAVTPVPVADMAGEVRAVAEVTLALILFHDAAQVRPRQIEGDRGLVVRLLLVGLPLTVVAGFMGARLVFPAMPVMVGLLLAAALAPTDAGLGAATVLNPVVPVRVRRILNVESGLNDGLITPVVLFAIAAVAGEEDLRTGASVVQGLVDLAVGALLGAAVGAGGGLLLGWSRRRDLSTKSTRSLGVLVLPILAYCLVALVGANSFVACFIAGTAFTAAASWVDVEESALDRTEGLSELLGFAVWLVFGLAVLPLIRVQIGWQELLFAVLSLTVFRMVPVAVSLIGTGMRAWSVASSAGSVRVAWRRWCSRCWPSRIWTWMTGCGRRSRPWP